MSTIKLLQIQGIRSFGTKAEDVQQIKFSSPVTLILGENGCGKTTIIECLKYALTGEAPPGSGRGQHFVHDPTIFDFSESLAKIVLEVQNIRGEEQSVTRAMKLCYKRGKLSFETLDGTISFGDGSISRRCIDVDIAMCNFMGVSKAIINNVIFCHQEESSWPLDEAKKLKEKFDAIFGITEYNKAIEKYMKMRKDQMVELKVKETNLKYLSHLKKQLEDKNIDLQNAHEKYNAIKDKCNKFDEEMKPIDERLLEIRKVEYEVGKQQALKVELETKQKNCHDQITGLTKKIKKPFQGSIHELDREIRLFCEKMSEKRLEKQELEDKLASLVGQEKKIQVTLAELDRKGCSLIQQRQKEQENTAERADKMRKLCENVNIQLDFDLEESVERVPETLNRIKAALQSEEKKIKDLQIGHDKADHEKQQQIDELRVTKAKIESDIEAKRKQKDQNERDIRKIEKEVSDVEASTNMLKKVTEMIAQATECYNKASEKMNQEDLKKNIADRKTNVARLQERFRTLDSQLTFLNSISKLTAEINLKEKELEKKEQEVRRVRSKHSDNFKKLFDQPVDSNYKRKLQQTYEKLQREVKQLTEKINKLKLQEQGLEIKRKTQKDELTRWEKELADSKDTIYEKCHSTPYEELLAKCKETIAKLQLDHGALKSSEAMYKKYIKKIEEDPHCPLCHNGMSENEASTLTSELTDEIQRLPDNIDRTEKLLKVEQKKYESLIALRPVIEKVERLEKDIPTRKADLRKLEENLGRVAEESESSQMLQIEPNSNLDLANSMMGDMSLLDEAIKEVTRLQSELTKLKAKLPEGGPNGSIEDVQLEKTTVSAELENERSILEKNQIDYEKGNDTLNALREERNKLKDKQIKLQEGVQSLPQLKERQVELRKQIDANALEMTKLQQQLQPLRQKLAVSIEEKQRLKDSNRKMVLQLQGKLDSMKNLDHDIQRLNRDLIELGKLNLAEEIERLKNSRKRYQDESAAKTKEISKTSQALEAAKIEVHNQDALERDLNDNRELKELQQKAAKLDDEQKDLMKILGDLDFRRVSKEKEELIKKRDQATVRKGELLGQMGEVNNQINKLKREIEEPNLKDSVQKHRRSLYEVVVLKKVIADLGQYRLALEWALMKFHSEKMQKINSLIREYWRQIYRGNDIDYIQIQTDENKVSETSADRKRSYNYRVIQSKNNSEIEMRGRCSAGQRVLACLIIRMALAETFSCNCGVLALDEPTTNLDQTNILSLCEALNRIVEERQTQSNFMLIIITHDEGFISRLGRVKTYHRVSRNMYGKSVIAKHRVN
ncbi:DNA repair protein RAD50 [Episyrphus balteatus]|uniref:DNA repair protein RAD50 n=1 Tax=Episyrphus balteatus TaxID=286459 RepID=UPI0024860972|nr:DNA repair protein RAD50 [Episyrphus balteatus]